MRADAVVPQVELDGLDAVGRGQHDVGVGRGEAGVVAGVGQGGRDDVGFERAGPGEADLAARAVGVVDESRMPTPEESAEVSDSTSPS